jgi:alkanesulfonate monooxygenase
MTVRPETKIKFFPTSPRGLEPEKYFQEVLRLSSFCDHNGLAGVLLFTSNDTTPDPWPLAQAIIERTRKISPFIAVNPLYMSPIAAAKFISSIALMYQRRVVLNMITGTSTSDRENIGDQLSHLQRYERLHEYIDILKGLLTSSKLFQYDGSYYKYKNLCIYPSFPQALLPEFLIAGQSDAACSVAASTDSVRMQMLPPELEVSAHSARGMNLGMITRSTTDEAWKAAASLFPDYAEGELFHRLSMENTDSVWKMRLNQLGISAHDQSRIKRGYWLIPFMTFRADCPYFVGSYEEVASLLQRLQVSGITHIILDILTNPEELQHIATAIRLSETT